MCLRHLQLSDGGKELHSGTCKSAEHVLLWRTNVPKGNARWWWHPFLHRAGVPDFWKGLSAWNFLWAECLKSCKLEWQIREKPFPNCRRISRGFQTHELWNNTAGFLFKQCIKLLLRALRCGFASCYVFWKSSWKELTDRVKNVERNIKNQSMLFNQEFLCFCWNFRLCY